MLQTSNWHVRFYQPLQLNVCWSWYKRSIPLTTFVIPQWKYKVNKLISVRKVCSQYATVLLMLFMLFMSNVVSLFIVMWNSTVFMKDKLCNHGWMLEPFLTRRTDSYAFSLGDYIGIFMFYWDFISCALFTLHNDSFSFWKQSRIKYDTGSRWD